ncbi:MAG: hypothetical protein HOO06_11130 [Bdellovibrionaceae bacterium]|jgi:hypothetical protein|nr:hypothetical protein [Pseudobdellovibrionaceae bacterium]
MQLALTLILVTLLTSFPQSSFAKAKVKGKKKKAKFTTSKQMEIVYGSGSWNKESTKIDSAFIFMKDKTSGRVVKISLEETEPDSSIFSGNFLINWGAGTKVSPEIYIPPQDLRSNQSGIENFNRLLRSKKIKRQPIVFKKSKSGKRTLDVYDTRKQAITALKAYRNKKQKEDELEKQKKSLIKPIPSESELEAARMAKKQAELAKLALEAANREQERIRQEQLEKQKIEEEKKQARLLKADERKRRKEEAVKVAELALQMYKQSKFQKSETLFRKSMQLDPENTSYYFKYAITLYRNKKPNEALVIFNINKSKGVEAIEKAFYEGLIHYSLKEVETSLTRFKFVMQSKHKLLSPSAAFYIGIINFGKEQYKLAKPAFEYVLDNSSDPKLDQKADDYIEKIIQLEQFKKNQAKKNVVTASVGLSYDSNILLSPDSTESGSTTTNIAGGRALLTGGYEYRLLYEKIHQLSAKLDTLYMYSFDSTAATADPMSVSVTTPYNYTGKLFGKVIKTTFKPGYEMLYMDAEDTGTRSAILNTIILNSSTTFIMKDNWFAAYTLDVRQDDSLLEVTDTDDDSDSLKITLSTSQSYFLDKNKKTAVISNFGYVLNNSTGKNKKYNRIDYGVTYMAPMEKWKATWTAGLSGYSMTYTEITDSRKDNNLKLALTLSKPIKEWVTGTLTADYASNTSTVSTNTYSKYTVMAIASFNQAF